MGINILNNATVLEDLAVFILVVDNASFTSAAEVLSSSKSMVSKRVTRLEKVLGFTLLHRSTRKLALTEVGRQFYQEARDLREHIEGVFSSVFEKNQVIQGTLRINAPMSFGNIHLVPAAASFMKLYPDVNIELLLGAKYDDLLSSEIDLAIRLGVQPDSSLIARPLMSSRLAVCATPEYWEQHGRPTHPSELSQHNCLRYHASPTGNSWHFVDGKEDLQVPITGNLVASSAHALESAALFGLGVIFLPDYMMVSEIEQGQLERVLLPYCQDMIKIYAVYPSVRSQPPKLRSFLNFLLEYMSEHGINADA